MKRRPKRTADVAKRISVYLRSSASEVELPIERQQDSIARYIRKLVGNGARIDRC